MTPTPEDLLTRASVDDEVLALFGVGGGEGFGLRSGGPLAHGFEHYFGDDVPNFPPYTWIEDDRVVTAPTIPYKANPKPPEGHHEGRPGPMAEGWRLDEVMPELTRRAVEWLQAQQGAEQPFFLYLPFTSPHAPIVPANTASLTPSNTMASSGECNTGSWPAWTAPRPASLGVASSVTARILKESVKIKPSNPNSSRNSCRTIRELNVAGVAVTWRMLERRQHATISQSRHIGVRELSDPGKTFSK